MKLNFRCRICASDDLTKFLDLGESPLANAFLKAPGPEPTYPLDVGFCNECNLVQLFHIVDKEILYLNYIYFSSGVAKLSLHFEKYAKDVMKFLKPNDRIVEIGSNDGILLKFFKEAGYRVEGVDPASNVAKVAESHGVLTTIAFFSEKLAKTMEKANLILGNNVVAHVDNLHDLARGIKLLLAPDGVFVFEAPYLVDMFDNLTYDTIYHEHLSYLTVKPLKRLFSYYGLEIFDVQVTPTQGKSLRVFVGHRDKHLITQDVEKYLQLEITMGLAHLFSYYSLRDKIKSQRKNLVALLRKLKKEGKSIAAYGAPAKGNTILNYCKIGTEILDYSVDDLPAKKGLFTPGMHVPVFNSDYAHLHEPDYYLLLAWNYEKEILEKESAFRKAGGKFIIPIGDIRIV